MPIGSKILFNGTWTGAADHVVLDYDARLIRRKRLETAGGSSFMVDLPETVSLNEGDAFQLIDGRIIEVRAAIEPVAVITGDLPRLAWHIGNRHTPCEITAATLVIRRDPVIESMLAGLGAQIRLHIAPFRPEGGAYGFGRTFGHAHD
jgi:urease accessory protein